LKAASQPDELIGYSFMVIPIYCLDVVLLSPGKMTWKTTFGLPHGFTLVKIANGALALTRFSVNVPCASWQTDLWNQIKNWVLRAEHFWVQLWQAEPRFWREGRVQSSGPFLRC
jgi:hypothetical protein